MIHGIYLKSKPTSKWHLLTIKLSAQSALKESNLALNKAKLEGNENAEVAIQVFESYFYIPEILQEVKDQKLIFN
jgi:hypothetical protein